MRIQPTNSRQRQWEEGTVQEQLPNRSYVVATKGGSNFRRNRRHLRKTRPSTHSQPVDENRRPPVQHSDCLEVGTAGHEAVNVEAAGSNQPAAPVPVQANTGPAAAPEEENRDDEYRTRSGRLSRKPDRYGQ